MPRYTDHVLKPCPFCGFEAKVVEADDGEGAYIQCMGAKWHRAIWFDGDNNAANDVADEWNKRSDAGVPRVPS